MTYNLLPISKNHQYIIYEDSNLSKEVKEDQNMNKYKSMDTVSNIMKLSVKELVQSDEELFQLDVENPQFWICSICRFKSPNRSKFAEHLSSHNTSECSSNFKAAFRYSPDFTLHQDKINRSFTILEEDVTQRRMEIDKSKLDQVNLQNVIKQNKSFRERKICKHCNFIANTKVEYWNHMRYHIKGFTCSECSFITRYKHHMTHHWLSVHDGSKPFKCTKCSYSCVSKSMLTSHLKKHSNIYPYRCANCTYKTKFCNALKKHLRKKEHEPAMVLNADGTPNPLSVIDVYGTKRGPKQKLSIGKQDDLDESTNQNITINDNHQPSSTSTSVFLPSQSPIPEALTTRLNDTNWIIQNSIKQNQSVTDLVALNLSNHLFRENATLKEIKQSHVEMLMKFVTSKLDYVQNPPTTCFNTNDVNKLYISDKNAKTADSLLYNINFQLNSQEDESSDAPLDLRITEESEKNQCQLLATSSQKTIGTNKRKGRAMKLQRRAIEEDTISEQEEVESPKSSKINALNFREENQNIKDSKDITDFERYNGTCHFCDIRFGNIVLFNMHMNCHSSNSPYMCTVCGHCCRDKISFFSHIYTHKA